MSGGRDTARRSARELLIERGLPIGLLALAIGSVPFLVLSEEGLPRLRTVQAEFRTVEEENRLLRREIDVLRARVQKLRDDPAAVEQIARDELGMVRQSEVVFQFPE